MSAARVRQRRLGGALWVTVLSLAGTVLTAAPLALLSSAQREAPDWVVAVHVGCASVLCLGMLAKLTLLRHRIGLRRARRFWASFVAQLTLLLGCYATVTGVLVLVSLSWRNQHLAASFWACTLAATHISHRRHRAARLLAGARTTRAHSRSRAVGGEAA